MTDAPRRRSWFARRRPATTLGTVLALLVSTAAIAVLSAPSVAAIPAPATSPAAGVVTADALPTVQIDGVVWSQAIVGNTVYAGGSFANARPAGAAAGTGLTPRANVLAYDLTTGVLKQDFAPATNLQVQSIAASPDGTRVYIAGDFTQVNGITRNRVAAFDTATGTMISTFVPNVNGRVKTIIATDTQVYIGGTFSTVNGQPRTRLAAIRASDGVVLGWNPGADSTVNALVLTPNGSKVIAGGNFQNVNASPSYGLAALDSADGGLLPWAANQTVKNAGPNSAILGLSTDGTSVYVNGYTFGVGGNFEGVYSADPATGAIRWMEDCHGDTYANYPVGDVVYTVSHAHYCGNMGGYGESVPRGTYMHHAVAFTAHATGTANHDPRGYPDWFGQPTPSMINWFPAMDNGTFTGQNQAAWTITGNGQYVVLGGEFPTVNGVAQQGLVRFASRSIAPVKRGPQVTGSKFMPNLSSPAAGTVRVGFQANYDQDDTSLTYRVVRNSNASAPVYVTTVDSTFFNRPTIGFTDKNLTPGATYRYRLYVRDPAGNEIAGDTATIVVSGTGPSSSYATTVLDQGASNFWRLGSSGTALDSAGLSNAVVGTGVSAGAAGAIVGDADTASTFNGTIDARVSTPVASLAPNVTNAYSASAWFRTTGSTGGKILGMGDAQTGASANYDRHIYLDNAGRLNFGVAPRGTVTITSPGTYRDGQWHQVVSTLGANGMVLYVDGQQVAARSDTTSAEDVFGYWRVGGDAIGTTWPNRPTSTFFTGDIDEVAIFPTALTAAQVAAQWVASGHGAPPPNTPPVASFAAATSGLTATLDATASSDPDGSVASWAWTFGDTTTGTGPTTSHTYTTPGTYTVALTVTDNQGASTSTSNPVTVTATAQAAVAADAFERTVTNGLGAAGTGGSWTLNGALSLFSVSAGTGRISMNSAGAGPMAFLSAVSATDVDTTIDIALNKAPTGTGGVIGSVILRRTATADYRVKVKMLPTSTQLQVSKVVSGAETTLITQTVAGLTYLVGDTLRFRARVSGTGTATLSGKVWKVGTTEPANWQATKTDTEPTLQTAGAFGLQAYASSSLTNAPIVASFDNLNAVPAA